MPALKANASISELQAFVAEFERARGFDNQTTLEKCLLLGEEVGELFRAVRGSIGLGLEQESAVSNIGEELADILMFVVAIANRNDVNLEQAVREKGEKNAQRKWS